MNAKNKFREGWIMLLRPFKFAELKKPLQKMTVLYAYSEKPLIDMELNEKGVEQMNLVNEHYGKTKSLFHHHEHRQGEHETDTQYTTRMDKVIDTIMRTYATQENYKGELVQCYVEGELCKFYPEEYSIISRETFDHLLTCDEREYKIEIEDETFFKMKGVKDKIFYTQTRGISKSLATKMNSAEAKRFCNFQTSRSYFRNVL